MMANQDQRNESDKVSDYANPGEVLNLTYPELYTMAVAGVVLGRERGIVAAMAAGG